MTLPGKDGSQRDRQRGDVGNRIEVGSAYGVAHPKTFLTGSLKAGIVTLALCTKCIDTTKTETVPVNGKPVIVRNGLVFRATPVLFAVVPVFVVARAFTGFGISEGTAVFLSQATFASRFTVFLHGEAGFTDRIAGSEGYCFPGIAFVQRNYRFSVVDVPDRVVNVFCVIPLIADESTFLYGYHLIGTMQHGFDHCGICNLSRCGQLIDRQAGDTIHEDMILVSPVEFVVSIVIIRTA